MRLSNVTADAKDAALSLAGNLDLTDGSIDARLVLSGSDQAGGARPDIFMALEGAVDGAGAQRRRVGADRMADAAGGR